MKKQYKTLILVETIIILFILITYMLVKTNRIELFPKCIFYEKFGTFCPSCGGTRFITNIFKFKFLEAFLIHPIFFITAIYLGILNFTYIINVVFKKNINIFKWWYVIIWVILLLIYTILKNILWEEGNIYGTKYFIR